MSFATDVLVCFVLSYVTDGPHKNVEMDVQFLIALVQNPLVVGLTCNPCKQEKKNTFSVLYKVCYENGPSVF